MNGYWRLDLLEYALCLSGYFAPYWTIKIDRKHSAMLQYIHEREYKMRTCTISDGLNLATQAWDKYQYGYFDEGQLINGMAIVNSLTRYGDTVFTNEEIQFLDNYINECVCILSDDGEDYAP